MNRVYGFRKVLTEFNQLGRLDNMNGRLSAITNIMLHPVTDKKVLDDLYAIYKEYTGMTNEEDIAAKFFKKLNNKNSDFHGYHKLKVRRAMYQDVKTGKITAGNIKGNFDEATIETSVVVRNGENFKVRPNYQLFLQDSSSGKTICHTENRDSFDDGYVTYADVKVVVEQIGKNGIQLTLFKYRKISVAHMDSSNYKEEEKASEVKSEDGLDDLFNITFDDMKKINDAFGTVQEGGLEFESELF